MKMRSLVLSGIVSSLLLSAAGAAEAVTLNIANYLPGTATIYAGKDSCATGAAIPPGKTVTMSIHDHGQKKLCIGEPLTISAPYNGWHYHYSGSFSYHLDPNTQQIILGLAQIQSAVPSTANPSGPLSYTFTYQIDQNTSSSTPVSGSINSTLNTGIDNTPSTITLTLSQ